jgi:hypothetical protein
MKPSTERMLQIVLLIMASPLILFLLKAWVLVLYEAINFDPFKIIKWIN